MVVRLRRLRRLQFAGKEGGPPRDAPRTAYVTASLSMPSRTMISPIPAMKFGSRKLNVTAWSQQIPDLGCVTAPLEVPVEPVSIGPCLLLHHHGSAPEW